MPDVPLTRVSLNGETFDIPADPRRAHLPDRAIVPMLAALCLEIGRLQKAVARLEGKPDPASGVILLS